MPAARRLGPLVAAIAAMAVLVALGCWQVVRLGEKRALIAQIERRLSAPPVAAPPPTAWAGLGRGDAYTRLRVTGRYRAGSDTFVQAVTESGAGFWVLTPLDAGGWSILVNRGFVPADARRTLAPPPAGPVTVTGLLRVTEPGGAFLRHNDPAADRWFSRDVAAIAAKRAVPRAAPYFVDADRTGSGWPRGGMTVVRLPNNHLIYALTWFGLALLIGWFTAHALRRGDGNGRDWG